MYRKNSTMIKGLNIMAGQEAITNTINLTTKSDLKGLCVLIFNKSSLYISNVYFAIVAILTH